MSFLQWIQQQTVAYTIYSLALAAMTILMIFTASKLFIVGSKADRLEYLKNYKKGQFVIIYIIAIPLYFLGYLISNATDIVTGSDVLRQFLNSVTAAFDLVKLDFGMDKIAGALADKFYYSTVIVCYIITVLNVLLFSASLLWQRSLNFFKKTRAKFSNNLFIVVGENKNNIALLNSLKKSRNIKVCGLMLAKPAADMRDELYLNGICYVSFDSAKGDSDDFYKKLNSFLGFRYTHKFKMKKNVTVIINTEDDERNLLYIKAFNNLLSAKVRTPENTKFVDVLVNAKNANLMGYVFCNVENQSAFREYASKSRGHINLLNRYEQIAFDFVEKYPLTKFMTGAQIDFKKGLIQNDAEINVCLVGFGPTNRQIFLKTISDAQFFTEIDGKITHKKVHYYVYDKDETYKDKNLNQTYFRYSLEFYKEYKEKSMDYLPIPDYPADDWFNPEFNENMDTDSNHFKKHFCKCDINSYDFYNGLKEVVEGKNSYTYIVVAFGEDLENVDLAKKIEARLETWGKSNNTHIFVKVRSDALLDSDLYDSKNYRIIKFGTTNSVYNINEIACSTIQALAQIKSFAISRPKRGNEDKNSKSPEEEWMDMELEQKMGNFYSSLNIRTKLNLLGYDYIKNTEIHEKTVEDFNIKYFGTINQNEIEKLRNEFEKNDGTKRFYDGSLRTLLAMQEHQRWNANYICSGIVPPKKHEIDGKGGGKDLEKRRIHYNLTTFDGLEEYRKVAACAEFEKDKYKKEVRHYDYKIMDYIDKILVAEGYKIIKKQDNN